jgi:hypothetical protein
MKSKRTVNFNQFVIWRPERKLDQRDFEKIDDFEIRTISADPSAYLASSTAKNMGADTIKHRLYEIFGENAYILNVLEDDQGHLFIPTGNFNVILTQKLPQQQIEEWVRGKRLQILSQSKWRSRAVTLSADKKGSSELSRILNDLRKDPQVEVAEQEVLTKFQRE